jgi:phenylpropionate dioxygenase-like ring-hydroxylating dioxygenase large terminal subunit
MAYLRNAWYLAAWYLAAWSSQLRTSELFQRRLLDEPLVLYRLTNGAPVALQDRCPHRVAPLHMGKIVGDALQCPYDGLRFSASGNCVLNPHGPLPAAARIRSFPVVARYSA